MPSAQSSRPEQAERSSGSVLFANALPELRKLVPAYACPKFQAHSVDERFIEGRPVIEYPCQWEYKAIGWDEASMREAIVEIMADREHELSFSRASRTGRYCSLLLAVVVESEDHRDAIFRALQAHRHIRMVL